MENREEKIAALKTAKSQHVEYMKSKMVLEDWHGVADAAMDIREFEAAINALESLKD